MFSGYLLHLNGDWTISLLVTDTTPTNVAATYLFAPHLLHMHKDGKALGSGDLPAGEDFLTVQPGIFYQFSKFFFESHSTSTSIRKAQNCRNTLYKLCVIRRKVSCLAFLSTTKIILESSKGVHS